MKIFVTNDDGYNAVGLQALVQALAKTKKHEIYLVAPAEHMSAKSHSFSLYEKLKFEEIEISGVKKAYKLFGTPIDCSKVAFNFLFKDIEFDLCLSGINNGANVDDDINYSGTFAAAHEANMAGFNSIALSLENRNADEYTVKDFENSANHIVDFIEKIPAIRKPYFYNINYPQGVKDFELRVASNLYIGNYNEFKNFDSESFKNIGDSENIVMYSHRNEKQPVGGSELHYIKSGKATIVPIKVEYNDYENMLILRKMLSKDGV